ncbi:hypothetical protein V6N13_131918 [Hibiscus sabdariffa]|uniref:UspA domain-containing protein n=1 Tax=Hibiscus sabdariffa TaxID=183260 RepID=A0ABR2D9C1_9ROSI
MEAVNLEKKDCKIVVAVDESEESMYALSWCLGNLIPKTTINNLVLLYVKPPPPVYSSLDVAGYIFSGDVIRALEAYGNDLVKSVMGRAQEICGKFRIDVNTLALIKLKRCLFLLRLMDSRACR